MAEKPFPCRYYQNLFKRHAKKKALKLGGRPTGFRRAPLISHQPVCKPGSGWRAKSVHARDGHSSGTPVTRRLQQPTRTAGSGHRPRSSSRSRAKTSHRPYSVLLPVGFAVPPASPPARCALTAPFHPCRGLRNASRRSVLCGTFPGVAPAGRYPAPPVHGARTFLPGNLSVFAGAAVRPTDRTGNGHSRRRRQGRRTGFCPNGLTPAWLSAWRQGVSSMAVRARAAIVLGRPRPARSSCRVFRVEVSAKPSTRSGRKWR